MAKCDNKYYNEKQLGSPTEFQDKCIWGGLITSIIMFLIAGPFLLFSDLSPAIGINPVIDAKMDIALSINKTVHEGLRNEIG